MRPTTSTDNPNLAVSIHASVKDATKDMWFTSKFVMVSIHASVKDATTAHKFVD